MRRAETVDGLGKAPGSAGNRGTAWGPSRSWGGYLIVAGRGSSPAWIALVRGGQESTEAFATAPTVTAFLIDGKYDWQRISSHSVHEAEKPASAVGGEQ